MTPNRLFERLRARRWIGLWLAVVLALAGSLSAVHAAAHGGAAAVLAGAGEAPAPGGADAAPGHDCAKCRLSLPWNSALAQQASTVVDGPGPADAAAVATSRRALAPHAAVRWHQLRKQGPPAFLR